MAFYKPIQPQRNRNLLAMTQGQAMQMLQATTQEAKKGNITPQSYADGLFETINYAVSPDQTRRTIRNILASPMGALFINNPKLIPPQLLQGVSGSTTRLGQDLLKQAKKDNLLRSDVTHKEIGEKFQRPLYNALREFIKINKNNPQVNQLIRKAYPKATFGNETPLEGLMYDLYR
jgi:hypothetical protein